MRNTNDGTDRAPYLRTDINVGNLWQLPRWSTGPDATGPGLYAALREAGYEGLQGGDAQQCAAHGLGSSAMGRVDEPQDAERLARESQDAGHQCITVHVGVGIESEDRAVQLVEAILQAGEQLDFPIYVETHRATLTQDMYRTVRLVERFPELRFNGDFSHWYTGLEMTYGPFEARLDFMQPVFDRVRFIHGRIGDSGCIQVDIGDGRDRPHVDHFRQMWTRSFRGFLAQAQPGDFLSFCPELLPPVINYARTVPDPEGGRREESDRWQQAAVLTQIARECFEAAREG